MSVELDPGLIVLLQRLRREGRLTLIPGEPYPVPSGLRVVRQDIVPGGLQFTLTWVEPEDRNEGIDGYRVYAIVRGETLATEEVKAPPATITVSMSQGDVVSFWVEPVYKGGFRPGLGSASVTSVVVAAASVPPGQMPHIHTVTVSLNVNTKILQYLDHGGNPKTDVVVTGVTVAGVSCSGPQVS